MLWVIICEVLRCDEPLVSWQMEEPILFFISYINVTDICVTEPMLLGLIIFHVIWFMMLSWNHVGIRDHEALVLWAVIRVSVLVTWDPALHPIYKAAGICQCFYLGMGH